MKFRYLAVTQCSMTNGAITSFPMILHQICIKNWCWKWVSMVTYGLAASLKTGQQGSYLKIPESRSGQYEGVLCDRGEGQCKAGSLRTDTVQKLSEAAAWEETVPQHPVVFSIFCIHNCTSVLHNYCLKDCNRHKRLCEI